MSNPEGNGGRPPSEAFADLEGIVGKALARLDATRKRAEAAERKSVELNEAMRRFTGSPDESRDLLTRLKQLEDDNQSLRTRLEDGRAGVERLIARIRFLENR